MIVLINGSFGSGKSTVAQLLRDHFSGSALYDPEWAGLLLRHPARILKFEGAETDDFQDMPLWRRSVIFGARLFRLPFGRPLIIPMTFSERRYFDEVVEGLRKVDSNLRVFCLQATPETVKQRLHTRGDHDNKWIARRNAECAKVHLDRHFGEPIETEQRLPEEIAKDIAARLREHSEIEENRRDL